MTSIVGTKTAGECIFWSTILKWHSFTFPRFLPVLLDLMPCTYPEISLGCISEGRREWIGLSICCWKFLLLNIFLNCFRKCKYRHLVPQAPWSTRQAIWIPTIFRKLVIRNLTLRAVQEKEGHYQRVLNAAHGTGARTWGRECQLVGLLTYSIFHTAPILSVQ